MSRDEASKDSALQVPQRITGEHQLYPASSILFMEALATNAHSQNQAPDHILLLRANLFLLILRMKSNNYQGKKKKIKE